jgi:lipopolysaccharide biosynthesis regulator YciM
MIIDTAYIQEDKRYIFERITMRIIDLLPYYEIKYIDNGERMTGFGTYSLAVLSDYLRQYFIQQKGYMWDCPKCGLKNHSDFKKCPICGYERHDVQLEENM